MWTNAVQCAERAAGTADTCELAAPPPQPARTIAVPATARAPRHLRTIGNTVLRESLVQSCLVSVLSLDRRLLVLMRTRMHPPVLERALSVYSRLGEHAACWFALGAAGVLLDPHRRGAWARAMRTVAIAYGANYAVKLAVRRRRPELTGLPPLTPTVSGLSFPSAHSTTSFAAARAFRGLRPARELYAAAAVFAFSRPYLGVHYPADVVAGAALGTLIGELTS